jgi:hypothetical protein
MCQLFRLPLFFVFCFLFPVICFPVDERNYYKKGEAKFSPHGLRCAMKKKTERHDRHDNAVREGEVGNNPSLSFVGTMSHIAP